MNAYRSLPTPNIHAMKTLVVLFAVSILYYSGFSQTQVIKYFGERYISPQEAQKVYKNLSDSIKIPFSEKRLLNSNNCWLVPIISKGVSKYILIKPNFLADPLLKGFDTLGIMETAKILYLLHELRPRFPNWGAYTPRYKFKNIYRTKEDCPGKNDLSYKQTISFNLCDDHNFFSVPLPILMESGTLEPNYISFIIEKNGKRNSLYFERFDKDLDVAKTPIRVLTMTYLKK